MYLVNQFEKVVIIDDPVIIERNMRDGSMREATEDEIAAYHARKNAILSAPADNSIFYQTVSSSPDGYGMSRDFIKLALAKDGILLTEIFDNQKIGLLYNYPYSILQMRTDVRLIFTMFESDRIPEDWPDLLKQADEVIVPSQWCAKVFADSGIKATVIPLGYNDMMFQYIDRSVPVENNEPFTFIHYDSFNIRKGFFEVLKAFDEEFAPNEPVKLILKTVHNHTPLPVLKSQYPNIEVVTGRFSERELISLLARANCMVYPSRGEGFGITPLEAMATGLPAIVPNAHGISEYFNNQYMLEVKATERCPALYNKFKGENVGEMVICDVADLRRQMRYAYNNQKAMKELGKAASEYVKRYTYKQTAQQLAEVIKKWRVTEVPPRQDSKYLVCEVV